MMRSPAAVIQPVEFRQAPHNIEAEQALLGAILMNNEAFERVLDAIEATDFFDPLHGRIYAASAAIIRDGKRVDPITLAPYFAHEEAIGGTDKAPGLPVTVYLGRLMASATSVINARDYAKTIVDLRRRRQTILIGEELVNLSYAMPHDMTPDKVIGEGEAALFGLTANGGSVREFTMPQATESAERMIAAAYENKTGLAGLSTGFTELDKRIGGLVPSDLLILAGRPSMGKSALALQIGFNVAENLLAEAETLELGNGRQRPARGGEVLFFSLEMSAEQLVQRQASTITGLPGDRLRMGRINEDEFRRIQDAMRQIRRLPMHIDTTGGIPIGQLMSRARRRSRLYGTRLIIVDYLQLMSAGERTTNRVEEVTKITTGLKAMAKDLDIPVLALSQLSRKVEEREDKRPYISDLRESGSIEQDADVVMMVYRDEYYLKRTEPQQGSDKYSKWKEAMEDAAGVAEVITVKQRHGPVGTDRLQFTESTTRFSNLETREYNLAGGANV